MPLGTTQYRQVPWYAKALYGVSGGVLGEPGNERSIAADQELQRRNELGMQARKTELEQMKQNAIAEEINRGNVLSTTYRANRATDTAEAENAKDVASASRIRRLREYLTGQGIVGKEQNDRVMQAMSRQDMEDAVASAKAGGSVVNAREVGYGQNARELAAIAAAKAGQQNVGTVAGATSVGLPGRAMQAVDEEQAALDEAEHNRRLLENTGRLQARGNYLGAEMQLDPNVQRRKLQALQAVPPVVVPPNSTAFVDPSQLGGTAIQGATPETTRVIGARDMFGATVPTPVTVPGTPATMRPTSALVPGSRLGGNGPTYGSGGAPILPPGQYQMPDGTIVDMNQPVDAAVPGAAGARSPRTSGFKTATETQEALRRMKAQADATGGAYK